LFRGRKDASLLLLLLTGCRGSGCDHYGCCFHNDSRIFGGTVMFGFNFHGGKKKSGYYFTPPVICGGSGAPGGVMPCCCCCWQATRAAAVVTTAAAFTMVGYFGEGVIVAGDIFMVLPF